MNKLSTELLREKYLVQDPTAPSDRGPVVALGNRMVVPLIDRNGEKQETLIVRAQNMHSCVRMAARLVQAFTSGGNITSRVPPYVFDWNAAWDAVSGDYEQNFNPQRWVAVYHRGKPVFEKGTRHALFDILENCAASHHGPYEECIPVAERMIQRTGKAIKIDYDGNVALVVNLTGAQGRMGIILRSPGKTTTFNFSVAAETGLVLNIPQCLNAAAAFLEGIQIAFMVGMNGEKIKRGIIARHTQEEKKTQEAALRLGRLNAEIVSLETHFDVHYRPEKPEFGTILNEAEKMSQKIFAAK